MFQKEKFTATEIQIRYICGGQIHILTYYSTHEHYMSMFLISHFYYKYLI